MIERQGWQLVRQKGSHRQFKHSFRRGVVTIAGRNGGELPLGTLRSVLKQAGLL
jgi:predicted RNA binding protein YcfA (HicA-like mRNA interferase family)